MIKKLIHHKDKLILLKLASLQVLINFATNFLIVKKIGFGSELDVFYIALAVFSFLTSSIGWSISSVLTPILIENREKKLEGQMFINILLITLPLTTLAFISIYFWSKLIFINYLDTVEFEKILIVQSVLILSFTFATLNIMFLAIFQERNQYIKINFLNMISAIIGLVFVYFTIDEYGVYSASWSQLVIQLFLFVVMLAMTYKVLSQNMRFEKEYFLLLWHRMKYIFFGSFYYRTDVIIGRYITSFLTPGFLSLVGFAEKVYGAIITVLNTSIAGPTITKFSNLIKEGNYAHVKKTLYSYLILLFVIDLIIFLTVLAFGEDLFLYFFSDKLYVSLTPIVFMTLMFLISMIFGKTLGMLQRSLFMSSRKEKDLTILNSLLFTLNIVLKITLTYYFGIVGFLFSVVINEILILIIQQIYIIRVILK
jgi:O-antigen/teichoic acid export membrane protein